MSKYKKNVYYYKKPRHIYAIFCTEEFIKFIDPKQIKFKISDEWLNTNHWPLLIDAIFKNGKLAHEITIK